MTTCQSPPPPPPFAPACVAWMGREWSGDEGRTLRDPSVLPFIAYSNPTICKPCRLRCHINTHVTLSPLGMDGCGCISYVHYKQIHTTGTGEAHVSNTVWCISPLYMDTTDTPLLGRRGGVYSIVYFID